jgi:2-oxoglutarate ferredoxin oxidoreductase subunit beta
VNNLTYGMTGGQVTPTTPEDAIATTSPYGNFEQNFNLPYLAESCGAVYVARWTVYHVTQLKKSMREALGKKGFSFVEIISPCPTLYGRRNRRGDGLDELKDYKKRSQIKNGASTRECDLSLDGPIVVGKFVDRDRETFQEAMDRHLSAKLGDRYRRLAGGRRP